MDYNVNDYTAQYNFTFDPIHINGGFGENSASYQNVPTLQQTVPSSVDQPNSDNHIDPPFPPSINPEVLARDLFNRGRRSKKMLNEFFLFRKEFVRELKRQNLRPRQTKVSALASMSWHKQKPAVKDEYRRLARETERLFNIERQRELETSRIDSNESSNDGSPPPTIDPNLPIANDGSILEANEFFLWPPHMYNPNIRQVNLTPVTSSSTSYVPYSYQIDPSQQYYYSR